MSSLVPFNNSQFPCGGGGWSSLIDEIRSLIYGKRIIEAQVIFAELKAARQRCCIEALTEIAKSTTDDNLRAQMFQSIWMLAANMN